MDEAHKLIEDMAHQPIQYWGAAIVVGSVVAGYISIRRMVNTLRDENQRLFSMLQERDHHIKELNDKVLALLEEQRRKRGQ